MAKKLEAESFRFDEEKVKSEKRKKGRGERKKKVFQELDCAEISNICGRIYKIYIYHNNIT